MDIKKALKKYWWVLLLVVFGIIGIFLPDNTPPRDYAAEATAIIEKLRNPDSSEQLAADYEKAEALLNEMNEISDDSDAFQLAQMELEALTAYKDDNIASEARRLNIKKQFSAWDGSHRRLEQYIKENMNDPKSYEHIETRYVEKDGGLLIITSFRGKNAFNAVVKQQAAAVADLDGNLLSVDFD